MRTDYFEVFLASKTKQGMKLTGIQLKSQPVFVTAGEREQYNLITSWSVRKIKEIIMAKIAQITDREVREALEDVYNSEPLKQRATKKEQYILF